MFKNVATDARNSYNLMRVRYNLLDKRILHACHFFITGKHQSSLHVFVFFMPLQILLSNWQRTSLEPFRRNIKR